MIRLDFVEGAFSWVCFRASVSKALFWASVFVMREVFWGVYVCMVWDSIFSVHGLVLEFGIYDNERVWGYVFAWYRNISSMCMG